ncbi:MAG: PaaI family thioesterase [Betaproteobacteria bacterium]|nr:PaaI family thioesterase [Betaproteobacteria bacterium]
MAGFDAAAAQCILEENFAPWVQELGLRVESVGEGSAALRLPFSVRLARLGGTVCGQALMSAADTAMVFALAGSFGQFRPVATVSQNISFMRPISGQDVLIDARVIRLGRTLAFGEVVLRADGDDRPAALATATCAIPD